MNKKLLLITMVIVTTTIVILLIILGLNKRYTDLSISQTEWDEIVYSRTLNNNLVLQEIEFNGYRLIIDNNDTIYYSIINDSRNKFNPKVSYIASDGNAKLAILEDEITDDKIVSDYIFKIIIYTDSEYHVYSLKCTNLPLVNIKIKGNLEDKQKNIPIELYLFNNLEHTPNRITISDGKLKIGDNYYEFSLNMLTPGKNKRENRISILNMDPHSEYILTKISDEPDEKNEEQLFKKQWPKKIRVELFINDEYQGVYSLEHIKKDVMVKNEQ